MKHGVSKAAAPVAAGVLLVLGLLASGGCAARGAMPHPFPSPSDQRTSAERGPSAGNPAVVGTALALRGVPYLNGGTTPRGFDCSGFTQYVYAQHGIVLPRDVRTQFQQGVATGAGELAVGDLIFFATAREAMDATHVAIAIGGDQFVHAPSSSGVVRVESLSAPYWSARYLGARRLVPARAAAARN
ncbi:MAG: C40 family peptidase [Acidobacteriota bacterium]